ncbi:hypothetical protein BXZ70DRAFT_1067649 [Cristinia sonorae]|uniref:F-box domain-containing protein n=1 Tax=Cristinia sonorae TaxID=1940300 RepID=A0A8K0XL89_9AGAR|nr:hypothetical protein BXZ70DRAFT_1067649 [Cristinia sonorae]
MAQLADLPPELVLKILSYLNIPSLRNLALVSHPWHQFFLLHESFIFHQAAAYHRFVSSIEAPLHAVKSTHTARGIHAVESWRDLCRYLFRLHMSWAGRDPVSSHTYSAPGSQVHRIKVDEVVGIIITSHTTGGLRVCDLETDTLLWDLGTDYVRPWAHVEYGNGFLVFDRFGEYKEVWRLVSGPPIAPPNNSPPDIHQLRHREFAEKRHPNPDKRGHFRPWALLHCPEWGRAFRFVYPTLLVGSFNKAYFYNVESAQVIQVIEDTQQIVDGNFMGDLYYVEVNTQHALICGIDEVRAFNRSDGRVVFRMAPNDIPEISQVRVQVPSDTPTRAIRTQALPLVREPRQLDTSINHCFVAAHISGKDLVLLRDDAHLVLIRDYQEAFQKKQPLSAYATIIRIHDSQYTPRAVYLAFEFGRIAVVTTSGIFIFTVDSTYHNPDQKISYITEGSSLPPLPACNIQACKIMMMDHIAALRRVTCLQMTETKLLFNYNPRYTPRNVSPGVGTTSSADSLGDEFFDPMHDTHHDMLFEDDDDQEYGNWTDDDSDDEGLAGEREQFRSTVCISFGT